MTSDSPLWPLRLYKKKSVRAVLCPFRFLRPGNCPWSDFFDAVCIRKVNKRKWNLQLRHCGFFANFVGKY